MKIYRDTTPFCAKVYNRIQKVKIAKNVLLNKFLSYISMTNLKVVTFLRLIFFLSWLNFFPIINTITIIIELVFLSKNLS